MERRRKHTNRNAARSVNKNAITNDSAGSSRDLPYIAELINDGEITIGTLRPVGYVATACDEDSALAMLVRQNGETLAQLLTRLDLAIAKAYEENIFMDEINPPPINS